MPQIDPRDLAQSWLHSREEDTESTTVYRPRSFKFPPARGRVGFELKLGGAAIFQDFGPVDKPLAREGSWDLDANMLRLEDSQKSSPPLHYGIDSLTKDKLVIKK